MLFNCPFSLIRLKRRYRELMNTMAFLAPRLVSFLVLIFIIYYCFAIIGMEFLFQKVEQGCCKDALYNVGTYYKDNISLTNSTLPSDNVYYLINFDNILRSYGNVFNIALVFTESSIPYVNRCFYFYCCYCCCCLHVATLFILMVVNNWYIIMVSQVYIILGVKISE